MFEGTRVYAPAKLNLFLHVVGRRVDGYHHLQSAVAFTTLADVLTLEPADTLSLTLCGPFAKGISEIDNLVIKAAKKLSETKGARIVLDKQIPHGAGLGGGSADAAATLLALNHLWGLNHSMQTLTSLAATLGSDVPACLDSKPKRMQGVGERLSALQIPPRFAVIVWPNAGLATASVYAGEKPFSPETSNWAWPDIARHHNSLQVPATKLMPTLDALISAIAATKHCEFARMSGSGSACFGIYETKENSQLAAGQLQQKFPDYFVKAVALCQ